MALRSVNQIRSPLEIPDTPLLTITPGVEPGWQSYNGYSSVGYLTSASEANNSTLNSNSFKLLKLNSYLKPKIRGLLGAFLDLPYPKIFNVKTTSLDTEFPIENIDLIKIDVQGAEVDVLHGAEIMLQEKRVDFLYVEWTGEQEILEILNGHGYQIYDSVYVVIPKNNDIQPYKEIGYQYIKEIKLSTGIPAYEMFFTNDAKSPLDAINEVHERGIGWIHTDLIAVSPNIMKKFLYVKDLYIQELALNSNNQ